MYTIKTFQQLFLKDVKMKKPASKFNYTIHNLIAHPLMEILHLIGFTELGNKIHDMTLPSERDTDEDIER